MINECALKCASIPLILVLLNLDIPCQDITSVDPNQLAFEEDNRSGSALFVIQYLTLCQ